MVQKGKEVKELADAKWVQDLAFMVDITEHLNLLNTKMQGRNQFVTNIYGLIRGFEKKLQLFESQLKAGNLVHFQTLKCLQDTASLSLDDERNTTTRFPT